MRLHRFYTPSEVRLDGTNVLSDPSLVHQLRSVFRLHEGSKAIFFDGSGTDYVSEIVSLTKTECAFRVDETRNVKPLARVRLAIAASLIKKDNMEWVVQKGTELGASEFIPLVSERSEKKGFNIERAKKIMVEACEQSGRSELPTIREPQTLEEFLEGEKRKVVAFHMSGAPLDKEKVVTGGELVALIGPEGGWSEREVALFEEKGVEVASLPTPVLRAETAAIAIASILLS